MAKSYDPDQPPQPSRAEIENGLRLGLIPIVGIIVLIVFFVQDSQPANQHGPNPKGLGEGHGAGYSGTPPPARTASMETCGGSCFTGS